MFDESQHPRDHSGRWAASQAFTDAANAHVDQAEAKARRIGRMFVRRARQEYAFLRNGKSEGDEESRAADASTAVSHAVSDVVPGPMLPLFAGDIADAVAEKMAGGAPGAEITDEVWVDAVHEAREEAAQNEAYDVGLKAIPKKYQRHIEKHEEEIASQLQENGRIDHAKAFARKSIQADTNMSDKPASFGKSTVGTHGDHGHFVTIEGHVVFIADSAGHVPARVKSESGSRFTRAEAERAIIEHHKQAGETWGPEHEAELESTGAGGDPFTFRGHLPTEIKEHMAGRPELRRLFKVTQSNGGGADAFAALGDRYLDLAELKAGSPLRAALKTAADSNDPEMQFLAKVHANFPKKSEGAAPLEKLNPGGLRVGDRFTVGGVAHRVAEDEQGYRVLVHGKDYAHPLDYLSSVPHDKGSFRPGKPAKEKYSHGIAFDREIMSDKAVILCARGTSPFAKIEADRLKVGDAEVGIYRLRKEIIPLGESRVHPVKGYPIHVTRDRADGWVKNFRLMLDRGRSVPAPDKHKDAGENYGKWLDLSIAPNGRGGDSLFGTLQVYGDQTLEKVLNKDVSICTKEDVADDKGNTYEGEVCDHISVTAFPAISDLSGWTSIAASRGESIDVPVFELSATQESIMDLKALRTALGAAENVSDADILTQAAAKITGIPAAVTAATQPIAAERDTIKTERDGLKLELDRRPAAKQLDGELARERRLRIAEKIKAIGGTPEWTKRATEVLCGTAQTPNTLMLDRASDTADDVRAMDYLQLVSDFKPAKTGGGISGAQIIDADRRIPDDDNKAADLKSEKEQAEQWKKDRLAERGIA